jgi:hypothetical protein
MRMRQCGDRIVAVDARPFRHADLSPREELAEARAEYAALSRYDASDLSSKEFFPLPTVQRREELRTKIQRLQSMVQDSTPPPGAIAIAADLNRYHAEFYKEDPPPAPIVTVADWNRRNAGLYGQAGG